MINVVNYYLFFTFLILAIISLVKKGPPTDMELVVTVFITVVIFIMVEGRVGR